MNRSSLNPRAVHGVGGALLAAALLSVQITAWAHSGGAPEHSHGVLRAFFQGFVHPLTGADHLAAMVAIGMWSALTLRRSWVAPACFVLAMSVGAGLAMDGVRLPAIEPMIAASLVILGLLLASRAALPLVVGACVAATFAVFHGAAHGQELASGPGVWALVGMVVATSLLHLSGMALGTVLRERKRWVPRALGAATVMFGAVLFVPTAAAAL